MISARSIATQLQMLYKQTNVKPEITFGFELRLMRHFLLGVLSLDKSLRPIAVCDAFAQRIGNPCVLNKAL